MKKQKNYKPISSSIEAHLSIYQNVIQRMANNSALAKTWCITLVSAILVIVADKSKPQYSIIALIPTMLFLIMDVYYLGLEKGFRNSYNEFIKKLHTDILAVDDLFDVRPTGSFAELYVKALLSFSVWPFYLLIIVMIFIAKFFVIG